MGGFDNVIVTASNGCAWTAVSNDGFITITSGSSGSGNGTIYYSVAANTSTNSLTGTIVIAGQTFTVNQAGVSPCTEVTLKSTSINLAAKGGSKTVKVKASSSDCSWIAVSNDSFITITESAATTVKFSVPGNTNTTPQTRAR